MGRKGLWSYLFSLITFKAILEYQALEVFLVYMQYIDLCFIIAIATFLNLFFIHPSLSDLYSYLHNSGTFCLCLNDKFPSILFSLSSSFFPTSTQRSSIIALLPMCKGINLLYT